MGMNHYGRSLIALVYPLRRFSRTRRKRFVFSAKIQSCGSFITETEICTEIRGTAHGRIPGAVWKNWSYYGWSGLCGKRWRTGGEPVLHLLDHRAIMALEVLKVSDKEKFYDEDGNELTPADYDRWDGRTCIKLTSRPQPIEPEPEEE